MITAKEAALNLIRNCGARLNVSTGQSMTGDGDVRSYFAFVGGGWVVPGHRRLRAGFVGVWVNYCDGRFEGVEFSLDKLIQELKHGEKPRQLVMF